MSQDQADIDAEKVLRAAMKYLSQCRCAGSDGWREIMQIMKDTPKTVAALLRARDAEIEWQKAELTRIQRLPEQEWAQVGAIILQVLASAAKAGYPVLDTEAIKALDRGSVYVSRLRAQLAAKDAEIARLKLEWPIGKEGE